VQSICQKNPIQHSRSKHIEIKHHFIRDHVNKKEIELIFVDTENQNLPQKVPIKSPPKKEVSKKAPTKQEKGKGKADPSKISVEKKNASPK